MHCCVVRESIYVPCKVVMSLDDHAGDLALLRSPKTTVNWDFELNPPNQTKWIQIQKCFD